MTIKLIKIISATHGTEEYLAEDFPGGLSWDRRTYTPRSARRLQDGTLIDQSLDVSKTIISLQGAVYDRGIINYLKAIHDDNEGTTFTIYKEDNQAEITLTGIITEFSDDYDLINGARPFTMEVEES